MARPNGRSLNKHEAACKEMRHFADYALGLAVFDDAALFYTARVVTVHFRTEDKRIVRIVRRFQKNRVGVAAQKKQ